MRDLSTAILTGVRAAVTPVTVEPYRPETFSLPFIWVRHPSTNVGPYPQYDVFKGGLLIIDIWDYSWVDVEALEKKLAYLDGHTVLSSGDARNIRYQKEAANPLDEPDACHLSLTYSVQFADMRVYG